MGGGGIARERPRGLLEVIVEESYRNTLKKLILLFFLLNFVEWVMFMFLTKPNLKIFLFHFKNLKKKKFLKVENM